MNPLNLNFNLRKSLALPVCPVFGIKRIDSEYRSYHGGLPPANNEFPDTPWLVIPLFDGDDGTNRKNNPFSTALGPASPSIWFETFQEDGSPGSLVSTVEQGKDYQIAVRVENKGNGPSYSLCLDIFVWTTITNNAGIVEHNYQFQTYAKEMSIAGAGESGSVVEVRSQKWTAGQLGQFPGDIIARAYDPLFDNYQTWDQYFHVTNDRHLAHKSFP